jgi:metal-responsive CopG/Arc/MetJ family transcriptional regulator
MMKILSIHQKYIPLIPMKSLSLKLDDEVFKETERIIEKLNYARNRYINEALELYNKYNSRKMIKDQLRKESTLTFKESVHVMEEFEKIVLDNETI